MILALLPALALATAEPIAFDSHEELEAALSAGLRSAIAAGWTLVDVSWEGGGALGFTLTRSGDVERHVAVFEGNIYRVGPATLPADPIAPNEQLVEALRGGGGLELQSGCGGYFEVPYFVDGFATGAEAGQLVARSLAAADDLEAASLSNGRAVFQLETKGGPIDLIATLTEDGVVAAAELRRYDSRPDYSSYRRRDGLARALRGAFVSSIRQERGGLVLRTNRGRFAIDPDGNAFRSKHRGREDEGCGC